MYGMARPVEDLARRPGLHDPARVHDGDAVAQLGHDAEVVGDEDQREVGLALDVLQQAQVLGLDRHVERGRRLVGDQQARLAGDGDGAGHALADAAAHLVRVGVHAALGIADPHLAQELEHALVERAARAARGGATASRRSARPRSCAGLSEAIGSCRIIAIREPRSCAHLLGALGEQVLAVEEDLPPDDAAARLRARAAGSTDTSSTCPSPTRPTMPSVSPRPTEKVAPSTAFTTPRRV